MKISRAYLRLFKLLGLSRVRIWDVVNSVETIGLRQPSSYEHRVQVFEVGEDDELLQRGVVAEVLLMRCKVDLA